MNFNNYLDKLLTEAHAISIPFDIKEMSKDDLMDALFMTVEDEDQIKFKRVWNQLSNTEKFRFIKNFKGKYTNDTHDKMYFILQTII